MNPDEFYVHKPMLRADKFPVIRRQLGSKLIKMIFATEAERTAGGKSVVTVDVSDQDRHR